MHTQKPHPLPYQVSARLPDGKCLISTAGNDRGEVALVEDEATAQYITKAVNGFGSMLTVLQALVDSMDANAAGLTVPDAYAARLREALAMATGSLPAANPQFDIWYAGVTVEGDVQTNMRRAYVAGAAEQALAAVQQAGAEFPQVNLREHQAGEAQALYNNFKAVEGDFQAVHRAIKHAARSGYLNGFKDGREAASNEPSDDMSGLLARMLAKLRAAEVMQAEFNRAITFAQTQGMEIDVFLKCWQHGDWDVLEKEFDYAEPQLQSVTSADSIMADLKLDVDAMTKAFEAEMPCLTPAAVQQGVRAMLAAARPTLGGVRLEMAPHTAHAI